ncbi:MAG: DUF6142 family protein [Lachnospiraceae bacterium]|nr:DUF6142 family protein [Lachnospiraceae bacterium]
MAKKRYLFSDKKNPEKGVFSSFLGLIGLLGVCLALLISYKNEGVVPLRLGAVVLLSVFFGVTGLVMGIMSHMEPDVLLFFPKLGIVLNAVTILIGGVILYMGV